MENIKTEIKLGDKIEFKKEFRRKRIFRTEFERSKRWKVWEIIHYEKSKHGVVVGLRTISNGSTDFDSEAGYMYNPKEYIKAILVATSLYAKPILIPNEQ